jgi:sterol desaturase/sphingolipid hydroxylase (fatty acid hydroxylase superfamily)
MRAMDIKSLILFGIFYLAVASILYWWITHPQKKPLLLGDQQSRRSWRQWLDFLIPIRLFRSRSFWIDVQRFVLNVGGAVPLLAKSLSAFFLVTQIPKLFAFFGINKSPVALFLQGFLSTNFETRKLTIYLLALVAFDFAYYWAHRASHRFPVLWELHKVHHYPRQLNLTSDLRLHPLDAFLSFNFSIIVMACVIGLLEPLGDNFVNGISGYVDTHAMWYVPIVLIPSFFSRLKHSHIPLHFGPWVDRVLLSPAGHMIHHSRIIIDKNFAGFFSLWDSLFGTYEAPKDIANVQNHLNNLCVEGMKDEEYRNILQWLIFPIRDAWRVLFPHRNVTDKVEEKLA